MGYMIDRKDLLVKHRRARSPAQGLKHYAAQVLLCKHSPSHHTRRAAQHLRFGKLHQKKQHII